MAGALRGSARQGRGIYSIKYTNGSSKLPAGGHSGSVPTALRSTDTSLGWAVAVPGTGHLRGVLNLKVCI